MILELLYGILTTDCSQTVARKRPTNLIMYPRYDVFVTAMGSICFGMASIPNWQTKAHELGSSMSKSCWKNGGV